MCTVVPSPHSHQLIAFLLEWKVQIYREITEDTLLVILFPFCNPQLELLCQPIKLETVESLSNLGDPRCSSLFAPFDEEEHFFDKVFLFDLLEVQIKLAVSKLYVVCHVERLQVIVF